MENQHHADNIAARNLRRQLKRLEISRPGTSRRNRHLRSQYNSDNSSILHDMPAKQAKSMTGSMEHHARALCRRSLSSSSDSLRSHSIRSLAYRTHRAGCHDADTIHACMHRHKKRASHGHHRHGNDDNLDPHLRQRTLHLPPRTPCTPYLTSRGRQFLQSPPYSFSSTSSSNHRRGSKPNCSQGSRGRFQSDDDTYNSRNPSMYKNPTREVQSMHLIHLALLQYEFQMDEWVEMMRSMPALQELDMEIVSFLLQDQENMMRSAKQVERATGCLQQYYTSHDDFKPELDDENETGHDLDHVLKTKRFSSDNVVGRNPPQQRHRFISPHAILAGLNVSADQMQDSQRMEQDVIGVANSAINSQVRLVGYQQAGLKEEATPALPSSSFHFPSVRYLTFRGVNIVPEVVGCLPNLESLAFEESHSETPADSVTNETAAGPLDESLELLADIISNRCPRITRLVLNESSLVDGIQYPLRIPALLRAIPKLHCFVIPARMVIRNQEIIPALLQSHREHLQSIAIPNDQEEQPDEVISSYESSYYPPEQQIHGIVNPDAARLCRQCLQVFESCPNLQVSDCKITLPLQEIMASIPNWPCRVALRTLRLQIQGLTGDSAMDMEEAAVMEMFIKSIFLGSRPSPPNTSSSYSSATTPYSMSPETSHSTSTSPSSVGSFVASPVPFLSSSEPGMTSLSPASLPGSAPSAVTLSKPPRTSSFHSSQLSMSPSPSLLSQGPTTPTSLPLPSIPHLPPPPTLDAPPAQPPCLSHQIDAVGQLVAIQYLVEHQLATMPYLEQFYLGDTLFRRGY